MKKLIIAVALVAAVALSAAPAQAATTVSVEDMTNVCKVKGEYAKNACMLLIVGFVDGYETGRILYDGKKLFCRPTAMSNNQMVDQIKVVFPFTKPPTKRLSAASYIVGVMMRLFPCGEPV